MRALAIGRKRNSGCITEEPVNLSATSTSTSGTTSWIAYRYMETGDERGEVHDRATLSLRMGWASRIQVRRHRARWCHSMPLLSLSTGARTPVRHTGHVTCASRRDALYTQTPDGQSTRTDRVRRCDSWSD